MQHRFWLALLLTAIAFSQLPAVKAAVAGIAPQCDELCVEVVGRLIRERQQTLFPVLANEAERFEPAPQAQCSARTDSGPALHPIVVAPFYDRFIKMPGTQNDATLWQSVFEQRGGAPKVLRGNAVTRDVIVSTLRETIACVRERDLVIVAFSGGAASFGRWGGVQPEEFVAEACTGTALAEADRAAICVALGTANVVNDVIAATEDLVLFSSDVAIELADNISMTAYSRITGLRASELSNFASQVRNRGGDVVFILDTNYAEGARLVAQQEDARLNGVWRWWRNQRQDAGVKPVDLFGSGDVAALYAASADELAYERRQATGGVQLGDLTYALTEALRNLNNPSVEQLSREADRIMKEGGSSQTPVFEATNPGMRLLSTREAPQANPDRIEIINPKMRSALAMAEPELEVVARYTGNERAAFASIDGLNVEIDPAGQFRRTVKLESRLELPIRIYGEKAGLLAERRLQFDVDAAKASLAPSGRRFALIIGNQDYANFDKLANPVADAEAVHKALVEGFGFSTDIEVAGKSRSLFLKDATATDIKRALFDLRKALIAEDQLVVYYAGHGQQDSESTSYWVPVDATSEDFTWIAASEISEDLRKLAAGSVLLISDSCYAGGLSRSADEEKPPQDDARNRFLTKAAQYKARQLIASGGDEPVEDGGGGAHSLFARALLEGLAEMPERVFTASELFNNKVRPKAVEFAFSSATAKGQTPAYLRLTRAGDQPESEFIFVRQ